MYISMYISHIYIYIYIWGRYIAFVKSSPLFREALSLDPEDAEECMLKEYCDLGAPH